MTPEQYKQHIRNLKAESYQKLIEKWKSDPEGHEQHKKKMRESAQEYRNNHPHRAWAKSTLYHHKLRKGLTVNITLDELEEYAKAVTECIYCGAHLDFTPRVTNSGFRSKGPSLDRKDNNDVLSLDNIQIICGECNAIKGKWTEEYFLAKIRKIATKNP